MVDCTFCLGRGWRLEGKMHVDWPVRCSVCKGSAREPEYKTDKRGFHSLSELARAVGISARDLYKVRKLEAGPTIAERVLDAMAGLVQDTAAI